MSILSGRSRLQLVAPLRFRSCLRKELEALGHLRIRESPLGLGIDGDIADAMRLNLYLRTAHRVLFFLDSFRAPSLDELCRQVRRGAWEKLLHEDGYLTVSAYIDQDGQNNARYVAMRVKDAIVDRMRWWCGRRPDSGPHRTGVVIYVSWVRNRCELYIDTSGEGLDRRGYRKASHRAPLRETLAAALVISAGWKGSGSFLNPMCGSGSLAIEAALVATNAAPGIFRENFGFTHLKGFDQGIWRSLQKEARHSRRAWKKGRIVATDLNGNALKATLANAERAGVSDLVALEMCDFADSPVPPGGGVVMLNPGYGRRIGQPEELQELYRRIGAFFKKRCIGYRGYVFTANRELASCVGLRARRKLLFSHGGLDCRLLEYELYQGSKKNGSALPGSASADHGEAV